MKNRLQISKTIGGSAMKRNVSTPGFSRLPTSIELTRLDSTTNDQDKEIGGLEERRLSSFFFEVQVSPNEIELILKFLTTTRLVGIKLSCFLKWRSDELKNFVT